jgi:class 3 adenylate cyclase/tetratricopeptide (TPR) repeat protein
MADPAIDLVRDDPEAYIARDRRRALAAGMELPDRVSGSALFADISGFTPLTEALANELGAQRGAEELTVNIGRVFQAVIGELDEFGGDVIYFSGDAITCWIDGDDGVLACAAALAMQEAIQRTGDIVTPGGSHVKLAMKVALAVGDARRFVVGDPEIQLIDVLAGRLIDELAAAEHSAQKGDVILEQSAIERLGDRVTLGERREDHETGRAHGVLVRLNVAAPRFPVHEPPPLPEDLVRPWLLPAVYERLRAGRGEFLTELRPAIPVFLRFGGIDYDDDDDAARKLDEFVRGAQKIMSGYGGNVLQLTLGDKGAYLYGVFGSPVAHEDDAARAAAAALELRDLEKTTSAEGIQLGITRGTLRSGTYGHAMRRTFVCLGDEVNLSARLMSAAPPGRIYVSERIQQGAGDTFTWERLPDMMVKGKAQPIAVFALDGSLERASRRKIRFELRLVGRKRELAALNAGLVSALGHHDRIVGIAAEAGMGKSRLVAEFVRSARRRGIFVAFGEFQAFGTNTSYFGWREVWRRLLRLEDDRSDAEQIAHLEAELRAIDPSLVARTPLLGAVVGLTIPDSDLTRTFDAKLRKTSLEDLLMQCLRARAATEPLVIVLEDCHWIDELSRDLLQVLTRAASGLRLVFVLAYRPAEAVGGGLAIDRLQNFEEIALDRLDDADSAEVIRSKLEQVLGRGESPSTELVELVNERADGNPLYIEELVSFIASQHIDSRDRLAMRALQLPESLQALILSRMDTVAEDARRSMKVASVIGRVFEAPMLPGAYPELGPLDDVMVHLETLKSADLVLLDREADLAYLFKHVTTQEVAYQSMPFGMRSMLHGRVAAYIEAEDPDGVDRQLDLLAHHYWLSDDEVKKVEYLGRAATAAKARYANAAAVEYYERLIPLLAGRERATATLSLAKVLRLIGDLPRAEALALEAQSLARELGDTAQVAWCDAALAELLNRLSRYDEASAHVESALAGFRELGLDSGVGEMLHYAGLIAVHRGDYATARERYRESRAVRERIGDWAGVAGTDSNLAILAEFDGDYAQAFEINERSLALKRQLGDRRGIGIGEMNAGYYGLLMGVREESRARLEEALRISREIGDRAMVAHALANLGNAHRDVGDYEAAIRNYADALIGYRELDNQYELVIILEDVGVLLSHALGGPMGLEILGGAEALRAKIGSPRPPSVEKELADRLATTREALGAERAEAAVTRGREFSLDGAIDAAFAAFTLLHGRV